LELVYDGPELFLAKGSEQGIDVLLHFQLIRPHHLDLRLLDRLRRERRRRRDLDQRRGRGRGFPSRQRWGHRRRWWGRRLRSKRRRRGRRLRSKERRRGWLLRSEERR